MERNKIIFSGQSNTFGLGLELEFRPRYNNHEWLTENGMMLPINERTAEDRYYWKKYRWTKLVCEELGYEELNVHDDWADQMGGIGGNSVETIWYLQQKSKFSELMDSVKYVIFELGAIRWWSEDIHEKDRKYPNTVTEVVNFIEDWNNTQEDRTQALNWLWDFDQTIYDNEIAHKIIQLRKLYPEVTMLKLPWMGHRESASPSIIDVTFSSKNVHSGQHVYEYITENKMRIGDTAKCFNGDYKYNWKDDHANSEGHKWVASKVIQHIRELENE